MIVLGMELPHESGTVHDGHGCVVHDRIRLQTSVQHRQRLRAARGEMRPVPDAIEVTRERCPRDSTGIYDEQPLSLIGGAPVSGVPLSAASVRVFDGHSPAPSTSGEFDDASDAVGVIGC
jgi:hypothetical protein